MSDDKAEAKAAVKKHSNLGWNLALIGLILMMISISMPMLRDVGRASSDGASKGNMGSIRTAIGNYAAQNGGAAPANLEALTLDGKYLTIIPPAKTVPYHADSSEVVFGTAPTDAGGWLYDATEATRPLRVNCTHTDYRGSNWNSY